MKKFIQFSSFLLLLFAFSSCKKNPVELPDGGIPDSGDTTTQRSFKVVLANLTGYPNVPHSLRVALTIESAQNNSNPIHLSTPVVFDQKYSTPVIKLPKGSYRIKKLILTDASQTARFATPVAGSVKASAVSKPLAIAMNLDEKVDREVIAEVLQVGDSDSAENFGYETGTFGERPSQPEMDKRIFIRTLIRVGEVVYDSIPVQLIVRSWDAKEIVDYRIHSLPAGTQPVYLPSNAVRYQLSVSKWGIKDELQLTKATVQENAVYDMGGAVAAKRLTSVTEAKIVNGVSTPLTKTDFQYLANGEIKQRLVWAKKADLSTYLSSKDVFEYTNGNITGVRSFDTEDNLVKTLAVRYNNLGRVTQLEEKAGNKLTKVNATYIPLETRSGTMQDYRIDVQYSLENGLYTDYYSRTMRGGSVLVDSYVSHNGGKEEGIYNYDTAINPYVHLRLPERTFSQYTRHNLAVVWKTWSGGRPENEPYDYKYTYDADGYPKEQIVKYRSSQTKSDTYSTRTVFTY